MAHGAAEPLIDRSFRPAILILRGFSGRFALILGDRISGRKGHRWRGCGAVSLILMELVKHDGEFLARLFARTEAVRESWCWCEHSATTWLGLAGGPPSPSAPARQGWGEGTNNYRGHFPRVGPPVSPSVRPWAGMFHPFRI